MQVNELWVQFQHHLRVRRRSRNTLIFYEVGVKGFVAFLQINGVPDDLETITTKHLREYLSWLETQGLNAGGIHARGRTLKAIFNWAKAEELIVKNPVTRLELPTLPKRRLPAVMPEHTSRLLAVAGTFSQPMRDRAMLLTLFDTGVRVSELVAISTGDLQLDRGMIRVVGKGDRERTVPIGTRASTAINAYVHRERKPIGPGINNVFINRSGQPLTKFGVSQRLAEFAERVSLSRDQCAPHAFRRGFAVQFLRNGGNFSSCNRSSGTRASR